MTKRKWKANTILPRGARLLKRPVTKKVGNWNELTFDATVRRLGITLLRVKGGFSERGDREDWICVLPFGTCSVSDYNWRSVGFGMNFGSFDKAVAASVKRAQEHIKETITQTELKLVEARKALALLTRKQKGTK